MSRAHGGGVSCVCPAGLVESVLSGSQEQLAGLRGDLEQFCELLVKWQAAQNLVSRETLGVVWTRHMLDSLQLVGLVRGCRGPVIDLGSGGGFPALPLSIALKRLDGAAAPSVEMIEATGRKVAFLRAVCRELGLNARAHKSRIEAFDSRETGPGEWITARALAPLKSLFSHSFPLLSPTGKMLFLKGREYGEELAEAGADWEFDVVVHKSESDRDGVVLEIGQLRPMDR